MVATRIVAFVVAGPILLGALTAVAADRPPRGCLGKSEQAAAISSGRAIPLGQVRATLDIVHRKGRRGDIISARLCESPQGLVYMLTLLARSGKVSRVTVNAATGAVVRGR